LVLFFVGFDVDPEIQFEFEERSAIFEVDGKLTREQAEAKALEIINRRYRRGYRIEDFKKEKNFE